MERKITYYVVKPEHREHFHRFTGYKEHIDTLTTNDRHDAREIQLLTEAKVLDLWCTPVYEKPRVKGWYNVYPGVSDCFNFSFAFGTKEEAEEGTHEGCVGQIFIDQEIE